MTAAVDHRGRARVVVTGLGVKTPAGCDLDTFWSTVLDGHSTAAHLTLLDPDPLPVQFGCESTDFDVSGYLGPKQARRLDRVTHLAWAAASDAYEHAGNPDGDPARAAIVVGSGVGGLQSVEEQIAVYADKGASRVSPFLVPMMMINASAGEIGMQLGWTGPTFVVATACAASTNAIGEAARLIRDGTADMVIAAGTESCMTPTAISAFSRMGALSTRHDDPASASRPFDAGRDGFVMGEGAAALVLERADRAVERGADVLAEVAGYGRTADAHHITAPAPGGAGAVSCMRAALDDAGLEPGAIAHINAHGTSTTLNDAAESAAIITVFGDAAPPVTSTKGVFGHMIGAGGAAEAVASILAMRAGTVPPTANLEQVGDDIAVDIVAGEPRNIGRGGVLSNSFGFGGHNATIVFTDPT
ncbi:MAG: beta-ketoacyl-ACP synthase II [Acidimicrobiia bacterium]|nr:beta-ketoacyl-ACP synthase II [Acidimicrobiia bacterium]